MRGRRLTIGMIGHVDHGKTALTRALTGMETDRLPEERRRGISIELGFAHFSLGGAEVDVIDMPGHERFVRTMIAGATGVDAALLVVAADEGVKPQTREHVDIAGLLGVRQVLVAVSKADLAAPEECAAIGAEAASLARAAGLTVTSTPLAVSARTGAGLDELRAALLEALAQAMEPEDAGFAWLPVDRAFSVAGHGTVVTGTLRRGTLRATDEVELVPEGRILRIRGLQIHGEKVDQAFPGQRVAINLRAAEPSDLPRGVALATPGLLKPSLWLDVSLRAVASAPELRNGARIVLLFGSAEVEARLRLLDRDMLAPNEAALTQLRLSAPASIPARESLVLRMRSPDITVAGGHVLDPESRRQRRRTPSVLRRLEALSGAAPETVVFRELEAAGMSGSAVARLARLAGIAPSRTLSVLRALRPEPAEIAHESHAIARPAFDALLERLPELLAAHPEGLSRDALVAALPEASAPSVEAVISRLSASGALRAAGGRIAIADADRDRAEAAKRHLDAARMAEALRQAGLTPPEPWKLAPDPARRRLLERLVREGIAVRAPDRVQQREFVFHREAVDAARLTLAPLLANGGLLVSEIGAALGVSRKFSVPLLEHLDSIHFTRRVGDRRVLAEAEPERKSGVA